MNLRICDAVDEAAAATAELIVEQLRRKPASVLGLPTGQTALPIYDALVRLHRAGRAEFSQVHTVNLDEFVGLSSTDPRSFRGFMQQHLFRHINVPADHVHFLAGDARDTERECARYERLIAGLGGIDLQLLGVGRNGHIGFNEPARDLQPRTHRVRLRLETRRANAGSFGGKVGDGAPRGVVDGNGDDSSGGVDRAGGPRPFEGVGGGVGLLRADLDGQAGLVSAAASERDGDRRSRRRRWPS